MIHRVGLFIASLAAAGTLVAALTIAGLAPGAGSATGSTVASTAQAPAAASVQGDPPVQVDTIYLAAPEKPVTITEHRVIPASTSGEHDGEDHESEGGHDE